MKKNNSKSKLLLFVILIPIIFVCILIGLVYIRNSTFNSHKEEVIKTKADLIKTTSNFNTAIASEDYIQAYNYLDVDLKASLTYDNFVNGIVANNELTKPDCVSWVNIIDLRSENTGSQLGVGQSIPYSPKLGDKVATLSGKYLVILRYDGDEWKILDFTCSTAK